MDSTGDSNVHWVLPPKGSEPRLEGMRCGGLVACSGSPLIKKPNLCLPDSPVSLPLAALGCPSVLHPVFHPTPSSIAMASTFSVRDQHEGGSVFRTPGEG